MNAVDLGMTDTPFIYFAINHLDCVAGIQVTASHHPMQDAGFRISGPKAKPIGAATGLVDIKRIASTFRVGKTGLQGELTCRTSGPLSQTRPAVPQPRPQIRVVIDASNGMAGWMVPAVFDNIPQLEIIPLLFETDGTFVHEPNPLSSPTCRCSARRYSPKSQTWASVSMAMPIAVPSWMNRVRQSVRT